MNDKPNTPDESASAPNPRPRRVGPRKLPYQDIIPINSNAPVIPPPTAAPSHTQKRRRFSNASWAAILGFGAIILAGTLMLKLPVASATGVAIGWSDALFTATSAVTVTGLTVLTTAEDFSRFGQIVILLLLQIGGVGFVSISVLLFRLIGRRVTLETRFLVQQTVGASEWDRAWKLALYILSVTLAFEAVGAAFLWLRWRRTMDDGEALWLAIFHSVSSYCNAGFDLFSGTVLPSLFGFAGDWFSLLVMGILVMAGGFGITVLYDLWTNRWTWRWALNTRFTLLLSLILTSIGFLILVFDPVFHGTLESHYTRWERTGMALFTMISARTAGLTLLDLNEISEASQLLILFWMFIGGAPASMAGGVSTSTVSVLLFAVLAFARGHNSAVAFHRTLPTETIAKAVAIMTVGTLLCAIVTLILSARLGFPIFMTAFEVISAFSNTGYSLGLTGELDTFSRYLIAFTMFWGRLGPITIVVALAQSAQPTLIRHPAEPVILG